MKLVVHNNGYIYAHPRGGRPISLKTKSMAEAKEHAKRLRLDDIEQAARLGLSPASIVQRMSGQQSVATEVAVARYIKAMEIDGYSSSSIMRAEYSLRQWVRETHIEKTKVVDLRREHIDSWINADNDNKYASRVRNLAVIQAFNRFCLHNNLAFESIASRVVVRRDKLDQRKLLPKITIPLTDDEIKRVVASLPAGEFWRVATIIAYDTGLRMSDIASLEWSNIDVVNRKIKVATGKTGVIVEHGLTDAIAKELHHIEGPSSGYLFPAQAAMAITPGHGQSALSQQYRRILARLGIEGKHFHCLRHSHSLRKRKEEKRRIVAEIIAELSEQGVQQSLGHKSRATTKIYLNHVADESDSG